MSPQIPVNVLTTTLVSKFGTIPPLARRLEHLYGLLRALLNRSPASRSSFKPYLKYAIYLLLLINAGSLPFVWHFRVFGPIMVARLAYYRVWLRYMFSSKAERTRAVTLWAESHSPVGANPFELSLAYRRFTSPDDADMFGLHLSNSSYAKTLDAARLRFIMKAFFTWGSVGGQMALGATHYHFIREIPPLATYEVRLSVGSWDHKWMYLISRYVTFPKRRSSAYNSPQETGTPATPPNGARAQNGTAHVKEAVAAIVQGNTRGPIFEPDGAILHCVAVSQICFKHGRITIPPVVALGMEGFSKPQENGEPYSRANPPPNWLKAQAIRLPPVGSPEKFRAFLKGAWREVPEGERWWEEALGGPIETKRQANLEILESLRLGLERTRTLNCA